MADHGIMDVWHYNHPTHIIFHTGAMKRIARVLESQNLDGGVLVSTPHFVKNGYAQAVLDHAEGRILAVFSDVEPNPTVHNVDACAKVLRETGAKFVIALGGGSVIDCAKAAATVCTTNDSIRVYHGTGVELPETHLPLICVPTTAGTGSEVTAVSVLSDPELDKKAPISSKNFYPTYAIIDAELTFSVPARVTAITGFDVLCHAMEAFWNVDHQPICDALGEYALGKVFENLRTAVSHGNDSHARERMAEASVIAGLAFNRTKTTSAHACSYPLTSMFHIPHGEACAMTIDHFLRINTSCQDGRLEKLAKRMFFSSVDAMADDITAMKQEFGLRTDLKDFHVDRKTLDELVAACHHPNMLLNPVEITDEMLYDMFGKMI